MNSSPATEQARADLLRRGGNGLPYPPTVPTVSVQRVMSTALPVASLASRAAHDPEFVTALAHAAHAQDTASMEQAFADVGVRATVTFGPDLSSEGGESLKASTVVHVIIEGLEIVYKALDKSGD